MEMPSVIYVVTIWNVGVLMVEDISTAKIVRFRKSSTKIDMHKNYIIVLPARCGVPASWAARHTTMCLDFLSPNEMLHLIAPH